MGFADRFLINDKGERKRRLEDYVLLVAGIDPDDPDTPRFLPVGPNGIKIDNAAGFSIPRYDWIHPTYDGASNRILTVTYRKGGTPPSAGAVVAHLTVTYDGSNRLDTVTLD